jgi:hypothetical protein
MPEGRPRSTRGEKHTKTITAEHAKNAGKNVGRSDASTTVQGGCHPIHKILGGLFFAFSAAGMNHPGYKCMSVIVTYKKPFARGDGHRLFGPTLESRSTFVLIFLS